MKISSSQVELQSTHNFSAKLEVNERFERWNGAGQSTLTTSRRSEVEISEAARLVQQAEAEAGKAEATLRVGLDAEMESDAKLSLIIRLLEAITGQPLKRVDLRGLSGAEGQAAGSGITRPQGPGFSYDFSARYEESESVGFSAGGVVRTADGAEIRFELDLAFARSYSESVSVSVRGGEQRRLQDPLVLDFNGPSAALGNSFFDFDLDADGVSERLPLLGGSGFLAFDRNADGRINDGRELFGPTTGDGFRELAALDEDGNGWIDENDAAWSQLRVWQPDAKGGGLLYTLEEAGVGAFYLGRVETPFSLRDGANQTLGEMRSSSIYLREDGSVGSVSQIDLGV